MQRSEAILVLSEICKCIPDESVVSGVLLNPIGRSLSSNYDDGEFDLILKMTVDAYTKKCIAKAVGKKGCMVREDAGCLIIFSKKVVESFAK